MVRSIVPTIVLAASLVACGGPASPDGLPASSDVAAGRCALLFDDAPPETAHDLPAQWVASGGHVSVFCGRPFFTFTVEVTRAGDGLEPGTYPFTAGEFEYQVGVHDAGGKSMGDLKTGSLTIDVSDGEKVLGSFDFSGTTDAGGSRRVRASFHATK